MKSGGLQGYLLLQQRLRATLSLTLSKRRWGATPDPGEAPPLAGFHGFSVVLTSLRSSVTVPPSRTSFLQHGPAL